MTTQVSLAAETAPVKAVYRKVLWRLLPFVGILYFASFLDRSGISYGGPNGMNEALGLTEAAFGLASGIFFIGYIIFGIPSSLAARRFGASKWIALIMVAWGVIQALTAFVPDAGWLYGARAVLGIAEAGFSPAVLFLLTLWLPARRQAMAMAIFLSASSFSTVIGGPVAAGLVQWGNSFGSGIAGWRFMFLIIGILPIILGIITLFYLPDNPDKGKFLKAPERDLLKADLKFDGAFAPQEHASPLAALKSGKAWALALAYIAAPFGGYALTFFLPTVITGFNTTYHSNLSPVQVSLLSSIPTAVGVAGLLVASLVLFRTKLATRRGFTGIFVGSCYTLGAIGAIVTTFMHSPAGILIAICFVNLGIAAPGGAIFSIPSRMFGVAAAAAAIALVNAVGNFGGFIGPYLFGWVIDVTGNTTNAFIIIAIVMIASAITVILVDRNNDERRKERAAELGVESGDSVNLEDLPSVAPQSAAEPKVGSRISDAAQN